MFYFFILLFRIWDCIALRGWPPGSLRLPWSCTPPAQEAAQVPGHRPGPARWQRQRWNSPLPAERLGAGLPHGAEGSLAELDGTWLYRPGPGKERHQEPQGLPSGWPLLLPGVTEVEGQLLSGAVHMRRDGEFEHAKTRVADAVWVVSAARQCRAGWVFKAHWSVSHTWNKKHTLPLLLLQWSV